MRILLPLAALALLAPSVVAQDAFDRAREVEQGSPVHLHLEYAGGGAGSRSGEEGSYALTEEVSYRSSWDAAATLFGPPGGELRGGFVMEWNASASRRYVYDFDGGDTNKRHEEWTCTLGGHKETSGGGVTARLEGETLRLTFSGLMVATVTEEGGCSWQRVDTTADGEERDSGTRPFSRKIPLHPFVESGEYQQDFEVTIPLEGRTSHPGRFSASVPAPEGSAEFLHCGLTKGDDWATGTCAAEGTLTVRVFVDPCNAIKRRLESKVSALAQVQAPPQGANEAAVQAWHATVRPQIAGVLADARAYSLFCGEDLPVDPWQAIVRAQRMYRDALLGIHRGPGLTPEGTGSLVGAERALQLLGVNDNVDLSGAEPPAPPPGTFEVSVHSPVSLHVWDDDGGHVGWNDTTGRAESTIEGGSYEGAPGGAQRIVVPNGFYRVSVDEREVGQYLLDVRANGTGAEANESWLVRSAPGRTTVTHYAVTVRDGAIALDTFPVHRSGATGASGPSPAPGAPTPAGGEESGVPGAAAAAILGALAVAAWARRRA